MPKAGKVKKEAKGKKVDIVKEASRKVYDLGPFVCMCRNCREKHTISFTESGTQIIIQLGGSRNVMPVDKPEYPCPKCGLRHTMRKPVVKKEEKEEETIGEEL